MSRYSFDLFPASVPKATGMIRGPLRWRLKAVGAGTRHRSRHRRGTRKFWRKQEVWEEEAAVGARAQRGPPNKLAWLNLRRTEQRSTPPGYDGATRATHSAP